MNEISIKKESEGISASFQNHSFSIIYPKEVWDKLSRSLKDLFLRDYGFASTMIMPFVLGIDNLQYNTPEPLVGETVKSIIRKQIPGIADDYSLNAKQTLERFNKIRYSFAKEKSLSADFSSGQGFIIPMSCGKDSLLTLGLATELGLGIAAVYVNDTVSPAENSIKQAHAKEIAKTTGTDVKIVTNNIEKLNDFETWNADATCLGYSHMITCFCLSSLPFLHETASTILLGNQQDMNFSYKTKEGLTAYAAYDQTTEARKIQDRMMKLFNKNYNVTSIIEPLANLAEMKILFSRYPELAKYEVSCDCLDASTEKRWCHACSKCARLGLFILAHGFDPEVADLKPLLSKNNEKYYVLFGMNKEIDRYEKTREARDQQLLAFYMAYRKGIKGEIIDLFKKQFLQEAIAREDELRKKFFRIYNTDLPNNIKNKLNSIFKEELRALQ